MADLDFTAATKSINATQGSDIKMTVTLWTTLNVTPLNITGYVFSIDVLSSSGDVLQALTIGNGITITSAPNGQMVLQLEGTNFDFNTKCDIKTYGVLWGTDTGSVRRPYAQFAITFKPIIPQ
jgi:hypothetical protein